MKRQSPATSESIASARTPLDGRSQGFSEGCASGRTSGWTWCWVWGLSGVAVAGFFVLGLGITLPRGDQSTDSLGASPITQPSRPFSWIDELQAAEVRKSPPSDNVTPNAPPNASDPASPAWVQLAEAAEKVVGLSPENPPHQGMSADRLRGMVAPNRAGLQRTRQALDLLWRECAQQQARSVAQRSEVLKVLARLLLADALLAERFQQQEGAIEAAVDMVRLGVLGSHGGMVADHHVGQTIVTLGSHVLQRVQARLTAAQCRWSAQSLLALDNHHESILLAIQRDPLYQEPNQGLGPRVRRTLTTMRLRPTTSAVVQQQRFLAQRDQARLRLLILDMSLRAHDLERKSFPIDLNALVPDYLPYLPDDPFASDARPPIYRRNQGEGYQLYSRGPNGRDDGGLRPREPNSPQAEGDLWLSPALTVPNP